MLGQGCPQMLKQGGLRSHSVICHCISSVGISAPAGITTKESCLLGPALKTLGYTLYTQEVAV